MSRKTANREARAGNELPVAFAIRFTLLCGSLYALLNWLPPPLFAIPLNQQTAEATGFLLRLLGLEVAVRGVLIFGKGFGIRIITECTAVFAAVLYASFVLAYPATLRQKALGLLYGLPILVAANLLRVVLVYLVGLKSRPLFELAHVYIGQIGMILLVLALSLFWIRSSVALKTRDSTGAFLIRFVAFSGVPFALWLHLDEFYVRANLSLVKWLLAGFGRQVQVPEALHLYPHTFNTFHFIAFIALVLATRSVPWTKKTRTLVTGLAVLCGAQFLFRLFQVWYVDLHARFAFRPFIALILINQWIMPFVLWLALLRRDLFGRKRDPGRPRRGAGGSHIVF